MINNNITVYLKKISVYILREFGYKRTGLSYIHFESYSKLNLRMFEFIYAQLVLN